MDPGFALLEPIVRRIVMIHRFLVASVGIAVVFSLALTGASQSTNREKNNTESAKARTDATSDV